MTPEELENLPKKLEKIFGKLEQDVMADIVERLKKTKEVNPQTDWLLLRMVALGKSKAAMKKAIQKALKLAEKEIDAIYQTAEASLLTRSIEVYQTVGKDRIPSTENGELQQLVEAIKRQTQEEMVNITRTTGFLSKNEKGELVVTPAADFLQEKLDQAIVEIDTGVYDYNTSIQKVVDEMTTSGLRTVDYDSGHTDRVEVAARRAVMTGNAQLADQINEKNAETLETDYWEVDWHMGARNTGTGYKNHQSWQGKVYSSEEMKTVCGLGQMLGFAGINCYHNRHPYIPGVSKRKYTDEWLEEQNRKENTKKRYRGKEYDTYSALQHQRKIERTIRKQNQDIKLLEQAEADLDVITAAKSRRRLLDKEYVDFSKQMGLRQQRERLAIPRNSPKVLFPEKLLESAKISDKIASDSSKDVDYTDKSSIIKTEENDVREMANGMRKSAKVPLSDADKEHLLNEIDAIGADRSVFEFRDGVGSAYSDARDKVFLSSNIFPPNDGSMHPRDLMSERAAIAHEYYGHRANRGTKLAQGAWNDEFRASYMAAKNCPNLSDQDRIYLVLDCIERAKEAGVPIKNNAFMRRILYGY